MNDGDQVYFDAFRAASRDVLGDHGLQGDRLTAFISLNAEKAGSGIGLCGRKRWRQEKQHQQGRDDSHF